MSHHALADLVPSLSEPDRTALVLRYWRRDQLTPLTIANSLAWSNVDKRRARLHA